MDGLTFHFFEPVIDAGISYRPAGRLISVVPNGSIEGYTHTVAADGGYQTASFTLVVSRLEAEEWFENGLGRHVEVWGRGGGSKAAFYGFINEMDFALGNVTQRRGPLTDITNRCATQYTPYIDVTVLPAVTGVATINTFAEKTGSQDKYGIWETLLNGGTLIDSLTTGGSGYDEAASQRDTYLEEYQWPFSSAPSLTLYSQQEVRVTVHLAGYQEFIKRYLYDNVASGTTTYSARIQEVLAADVNGLFSADYTQLATNASVTSTEENGYSTGQAVIDELLKRGDVTGMRYMFRVDDKIRGVYAGVPSIPAYEHHVAEDNRIFAYGGGAEVMPWEVEPGQWMFLTNYLVGREQPTSELRKDPRYIFIESCQFSAPNALTVTGTRLGIFERLVTRMGGGG